MAIGDMPKTPISPKASKSVMDFRPSQGLASGLKRIGGRNGISRLGRATADAQKHGRIRISHRY
ncbi:MAG TPA: hypothetical protein VNH84_07515 [Candidatus Saccharimonadales bacterium]|nr:hypothetical protein [Candidatus Saccharimonadales bacterium]